MTLPPGFRFHPTDEELVAYYLKRRVNSHPIDFDVIADVDLYKCEPDDLPSKSRLPGIDLEWFFFSPRDRKYPNGSRTNRATRTGYWKATGRDRYIKTGGQRIIGMKKTLVFYRGRAPQGVRTEWLMHEYRLDGTEMDSNSSSHVLCRVFKKVTPDAQKRSKADAVDDVADSGGSPPQSPNVGNPGPFGVNQQVFDEADVKPTFDSPATPPLSARPPMHQQQDSMDLHQQQDAMDLQQQQAVIDQQQPGHLDIVQVLDYLPPVQPMNGLGEFEKFDSATLADFGWLDNNYDVNAQSMPAYPEDAKMEFKNMWSREGYVADGLATNDFDNTLDQFGNHNLVDGFALPPLVQSPSPPAADSTSSQDCYIQYTPDVSNIVIRPRSLNNTSPTTGLRPTVTTAKKNIKFQRVNRQRSASSAVSDDSQEETSVKSSADVETSTENSSPKAKEKESFSQSSVREGDERAPEQLLTTIPSEVEKLSSSGAEPRDGEVTEAPEAEPEGENVAGDAESKSCVAAKAVEDSEICGATQKGAEREDHESAKENAYDESSSIVGNSDAVLDCSTEEVKQRSLAKLAKLLGSLRVQLTTLLEYNGNLKTLKLPPSIGAIHLNAVVWCSCEKGNGRPHTQTGACQCFGDQSSKRRQIPSEAIESSSEDLAAAVSWDRMRGLGPRKELIFTFFIGVFSALVGVPFLEKAWRLFQAKQSSV